MRILTVLGVAGVIGLGTGCAARQSVEKQGPIDRHVLAANSAGAAGLRRELAGIQKAAAARAENIANAATPGYRRVLPVFLAGGEVEVRRDMKQGKLAQTGGNADLAIFGTGFFKLVRIAVSTNGERHREAVYTRDGHFVINQFGELAWSGAEEWVLDPPIVFPANLVEAAISSDGRVFCVFAGSTEPMQVGSVFLAHFDNEEELSSVDGVRFTAVEMPTMRAAGSLGMGTVEQDALENSNVDALEELRELAKLSERYGLAKQALQLYGPG